ncbi:enoyl-CoA hydratase/isomerase family protein [Tropicimonas sp.]|uniref:enoyl-CoA hydratase/isomerase family protein n=1 Tax=Tropicimonas sp. TaxID=2067044 RepID=UPI003A8C3FF1
MIEVDRAGPVWTLRLNRPDKANSLTRDMLVAIEAAAGEAGEAGVAGLVLTGAGTVFSAGADLDEARAGLATDPIWELLSARIAALPCLTVAALNGTLAGGAFGMVLACDLRLAVPEAHFFYPVMKLGFLPQPSDPVRMARLVGPARTRMILMAGQKLDAETAYGWGLVDRIVAPGALAETVAELTGAAVSAPPDIRCGIKGMIPD